ncbi:MAG: hypothetical protein M3Z22_08515 [Verrucomicrobiota bacterium]|nr:hypothetical protein [Verrucomicrobiota bacterium]
MFLARTASLLVVVFGVAAAAHGQLADRENSEAVRVTVSVNPDGSHTSYEFDPANHRAVATTTTADGKSQGKTRYVLDDAGRFATGEVFAADGKFRFKSRYKYDAAGHLAEEIQLNKEDAVQHRIVYSYDAAGKQTGYAILDATGKLLGQTTPISPAATTAAKPKTK